MDYYELLILRTRKTGCTGYRLEALVTGMGELATVLYAEIDVPWIAMVGYYGLLLIAMVGYYGLLWITMTKYYFRAKQVAQVTGSRRT